MSNLPADFTEKMRTLLGEEFDDFLKCYENDKYQALRFNPLKNVDVEIGKEQIFAGITQSATESFEGQATFSPVLWEPTGYYYDGNLRPGKHAYHEAGVYYIQEPSAMSAAALLAPKPGMRVLDLCAAPGGKTTQLAGYLKGEGLLVANEIHPARCKILSQNVERMGIKNAIVTNEDSGKLAEHFLGFFHAILVDAPCSGEGMFRKNPEAMGEWSKSQVLVCAKRQREILDHAAKMLMGGGTLVYSTCTFSPEENEQVIADFLLEHEEFEVVQVNAPYFSTGNPLWAEPVQQGAEQSKDRKDRQPPQEIARQIERTFRLWPHKLQGEGHFVAVLKKAGACMPVNATTPLSAVTEPGAVTKENGGQFKPEKKKRAKVNSERGNGTVTDKALLSALEEFLSGAVRKEMAGWIRTGTLTLFGEQLYRLPDGAPSLRGLKVLRAGLHIGTFKKNRFEPSHALALALSKAEVCCAVNLKLSEKKDSRVAAFFRGESFHVTESECYRQSQPSGMAESDKACGANGMPESGKACGANGMSESGKACGANGNCMPENGWVLVCVDGFSAGWGKLVNGQVKNHYPKGLRCELYEL